MESGKIVGEIVGVLSRAQLSELTSDPERHASQVSFFHILDAACLRVLSLMKAGILVKRTIA